MEENDKFLKLNAKYTKLSAEHTKLNKVLNLIASHVPHLVFDTSEETILYFSRVGKIFYLNNCKENICMVCGKAINTTAHHLIPLRAKCKNKILKELRIRICNDCDKKVHPENKYLRINKILQKKDKIIKILRERLKDNNLSCDVYE